MRRYRWLKALKIVTFVAAGSALLGYVVERLWNWLAPSIIGLKPISFAQALGLLVLSKILLGGWSRGSRRGWSRVGRERWARMSPEERERFRAGMRNRGACRWDGLRQTAPEEVAK